MQSKKDFGGDPIIRYAGSSKTEMALIRTIPRPTMKVALPLLLVLIAGLGVVHLLIRTSRYGAFIQGDAGRYLNMAAGQQLDGTFPPGYPLSIAVLGLAGIDPREAARLINIIAFGLTLLAAGFWLHRYVKSYFVACMAALSLAVSVPLNYYASFILSEALFTLFLVLALICSGESMRGNKKRDGRLWRVSAAILASLASVTRYAGATVIAALALVILLQRGASLVDKLKSGILLGVVSSIPLATVFAYNEMLHGQMFGGHYIAPAGERNWLNLNFESRMQTLNVPDWLLLLSVLTACALTVAGGWMAYVRCTSSRSTSSFDWAPMVPFLVFAAVYGVLLLTVVPIVARGISERYLAVLYVPVFLCAAILVDRFLGMKVEGLRATTVKWTAVSLVAVGVSSGGVLSVRANLRTTADAMESGHSEAYNNARWEMSETLNYIRANPPRTRIFSNHPHVFHLIGPPTYTATFTLRGFEGLRRQVEQEAGGAAIVWFTEDPVRPPEYGPAEIGELAGVERIVRLSDGAVYFVSPSK